MLKKDVEYFRRRAVHERTQAVTAMSDDAAAVHVMLAERCEALVNIVGRQSVCIATDHYRF